MKIQLLCVGKHKESYLQKAIEEYSRRLIHYIPFELILIPDVKQSQNMSKADVKQREGEQILKLVKDSDQVVLFDENGSMFTSREFALKIEKMMLSSHKIVSWVIGGAFGFSQEVYARANEKHSLSKMTFSHQMVRLFAIEQFYRAMTILKGESYHHD